MFHAWWIVVLTSSVNLDHLSSVWNIQCSVPLSLRTTSSSSDAAAETTAEAEATTETNPATITTKLTTVSEHFRDCSSLRGLFVEESLNPDSTVFTIPLSSCLCDNDIAAIDSDSWAVRLASLLMDWIVSASSTSTRMPNNNKLTKAQQAWKSLLQPTIGELRESLPIHWDENLISSCLSKDLELTVDSFFFVRADAIDQLQQRFPWASTQDCNNVLDIVQTRSCRLEPGIRVLAPVFDMINHGGRRHTNAQFFRKDNNLIVQTIQSIPKGTELLIDYGESTRPSWRCLFSYGFVPNYDDDENDDDEPTELVVDGISYRIEPKTLPYELVEAASKCSGISEGNSQGVLDLTPAICNYLVGIAVEQAQQQQFALPTTKTPNSHAERLICDLRNQRRNALLKLARRLQEYIHSQS
jgi:SET domain